MRKIPPIQKLRDGKNQKYQPSLPAFFVMASSREHVQPSQSVSSDPEVEKLEKLKQLRR